MWAYPDRTIDLFEPVSARTVSILTFPCALRQGISTLVRPYPSSRAEKASAVVPFVHDSASSIKHEVSASAIDSLILFLVSGERGVLA